MLYNYVSYTLLLESKRKDQLKRKYVDKLGISEDIFNKLYTKNAEWLLKIYYQTNQDEKTHIEDNTSYSFVDLLLKYAEIYDNNKSNLSIKKISDLSNIDDMRKTLDEIRNFDDIYETKNDNYWCLYNDHEWCIYKPYKFEYSETAENKKRDNNWCTTYDEEHFKLYFGPEGGLLYVCNKLEETEDIALEISENSINAWNWKDENIQSYSLLEDIIPTLWEKYELPYKILSENIKELYNDTPRVCWDTARDNMKDEIMSWEYSRYNELYIYSNYVWRNVDDNNFLDDVKDDERERISYDWQNYNNLLNHFLIIFYKYFSNYESFQKTSKKYFIEKMKEYNDEETKDMTDEEKIEHLKDYGYNTKNPSYNDIEVFIEDNLTESDAPEIIKKFGFEDDIIEILTDEYMDNFNDAEDYVKNIYDDIYSTEAISYVKDYINWEDLANDIVEDASDETLRNYL